MVARHRCERSRARPPRRAGGRGRRWRSTAIRAIWPSTLRGRTGRAAHRPFQAGRARSSSATQVPRPTRRPSGWHGCPDATLCALTEVRSRSHHGRTDLDRAACQTGAVRAVGAGCGVLPFGEMPQVGADSAAVIVEPIRAGGRDPRSRRVPARSRRLEPLLIVDEVQTGIGRTGSGSPISTGCRTGHGDLGLGGSVGVADRGSADLRAAADMLHPASTGRPSAAVLWRVPRRWRSSTRSRPRDFCSATDLGAHIQSGLSQLSG